MFIPAAMWLALGASSAPATLILYRDQAEPLLFKPALIIDGVEIGRLGQNRFLAVELAAGPHRVEAAGLLRRGTVRRRSPSRSRLARWATSS